MDKKIQSRFFTIASCYLDDDRIMAHCIFEILHTIQTPEEIYKDLLACRYTIWIDALEQIAEDTKWSILQEWCKQKQFELDMLNSPIWSRGDFKTLEMEGWK